MNTPAEQRDYAQGALLLLRLTGNQIMYRNLMANPKRNAQFIEYQLQKRLNFRLQKLTHEQVEQMQRQVDVIVKKRLSLKEDNPAADFRKGKRADHDELPDEIQALYVENLGIVQKMRELHLKLRSLSLDNAPCPDSERSLPLFSSAICSLLTLVWAIGAEAPTRVEITFTSSRSISFKPSYWLCAIMPIELKRRHENKNLFTINVI